MSYRERQWARLASHSEATGRKFAQMERTAWGERTTNPFMEPNSIEFKGRIIHGERPTDDEGDLVVIGFHHPLFSGAINRFGVVEVFENIAADAPLKYMAKGRGIHRLMAFAVCDDPGFEVIEPCTPNTEECDSYRVVYGPPGAGPEDTDAFNLYDVDTRFDAIERNELPAQIVLRGYSGSRQLPAFPGWPVVMNWNPGVNVFRPSFQRCGKGLADTPWDWCCWWVRYFADLYGDDWRNVITADEATPLLQLCGGIWIGRDWGNEGGGGDEEEEEE